MRLIELPMPEGGAELEVTFWTHHGCPPSRIYKRGGTDEDFSNIDQVLFPVGIAGSGVPAGVPFEVQTIAECRACGKYLKQMFAWKKRLVLA